MKFTFVLSLILFSFSLFADTEKCVKIKPMNTGTGSPGDLYIVDTLCADVDGKSISNIYLLDTRKGYSTDFAVSLRSLKLKKDASTVCRKLGFGNVTEKKHIKTRKIEFTDHAVEHIQGKRSLFQKIVLKIKCI